MALFDKLKGLFGIGLPAGLTPISQQSRVMKLNLHPPIFCRADPGLLRSFADRDHDRGGSRAAPRGSRGWAQAPRAYREPALHDRDRDLER